MNAPRNYLSEQFAPSYMGPRVSDARSAVVILSGGQDSAVTALLAKEWCSEVRAIHFAYGQRHIRETEAAHNVAQQLGIDLKVFYFGLLEQLGDSALINPLGDVNAKHRADTTLPATFVPGRNVLFIAAAAAYAYRCGANEIWAGVCEADSSGYPDCRGGFLSSMQYALQQGLGYGPTFERAGLRLVAPLLHETKADIFELAAVRGQLEMIRRVTHTCYQNGDTEYPWGFGCVSQFSRAPDCPACKLRAKGWDEFKARCMGEENAAREQRYRDLVSRLTRDGYSFDEVGAELALHHTFYRGASVMDGQARLGG